MKKKYIIFILILAVIGTWGSCKKDFLTVSPAGSLDQSLLQSKDGLEALLVGAYSLIDDMSSQFGWESAGTNWVYGSIRGMEANKGTDTGDQQDINPLMNFNEQSTNPYLNVKWREVYEAISRCNNLIILTNRTLAAGKIEQADADLFIAQARVLRGWFHFEAWRMWEKIPYLDETTDPSKVANDLDQNTLQGLIIADITEGTKLPLDMGAIGKFNKTVSQVILAKALMQMKPHNYAAALPLLADVKVNGKKPDGKAIGLAPTYGEIFDIVNRNGIESVYTVQYSVNDNSGGNNGGNGEVLNFPYKGGGSPGGCCGFFNPTQDFVNSFRTSAGLPLLDNSYDTPAQAVINDYGVSASNVWAAATEYAKDGIVALLSADGKTHTFYKSLIEKNKGNAPATSPAAWVLSGTPWTMDAGPLDPRLDWSVGRKGVPYWDWGIHTGQDWIRLQSYSGPYSPKKQVYKKSQEGQYTEVGNWTSGWTANGYRFIRYADVLLMLAECQIETGDLAGALANINAVRNRAANPEGFVKMADGVTLAGNYVIAPYTTLGTQDEARVKLRMERKLELGQEGHRYFDLQRWGTVVSELNRIHAYERGLQWGSNLYPDASWGLGAEDVNFPIPQNQIDISQGKLVQNR